MIPETLLIEIKQNKKWLTTDTIIQMLEEHNSREKETQSQQKNAPKITEKEIENIVNEMNF